MTRQNAFQMKRSFQPVIQSLTKLLGQILRSTEKAAPHPVNNVETCNFVPRQFRPPNIEKWGEGGDLGLSWTSILHTKKGQFHYFKIAKITTF